MAENSSKIVCPACHQVNFIRFGLILPCFSCKRHLQHIRCPHCEFENVWSRKFPGEEGRTVECLSCFEKFRFFNCSKCEKTTFWTPFQPTNFVKKNCRRCHKSLDLIRCDFCSNFLVDPSAGSLKNGSIECYSCLDQNSIIRCPHCSTVETEKHSNETQLQTTRCRTCQKAFAFLRCFHCEKTNLWPTVNVDIGNFQCFSCGKDLKEAPVESKVALGRRPHRPASAERRPSYRPASAERRRPYRPASAERRPSYRPASAERPPGSPRLFCPYFSECLEFVKQLQWPRNVFNANFNKCYCRKCYHEKKPSLLNVAGSTYVVPRDWVGFGLGVDPFLIDNLWKTYLVVYHGTTAIAAKSIIHHRQFLLPGDVLLGGTKLGIRLGHIPGKKYIYTSPSIHYASLDAYSEPYSFRSPKTGQWYRAQIVLQARQKPGTFKIQRETVGWGSKPICPFIDNDHIEYFTDRRSSVIPYRLLVRLEKFD